MGSGCICFSTININQQDEQNLSQYDKGEKGEKGEKAKNKMDSVSTLNQNQLVKTTNNTTYMNTNNIIKFSKSQFCKSRFSNEVEDDAYEKENQSFRSSIISAHSVNNINDEFNINFHDYAVSIFKTVTNLRNKPRNYLGLLSELLGNLKTDLGGKIFLEMETCTYYFQSKLEDIVSLKELILSFSEDEKGIINTNLLWSEAMFQTCQEYLNGENEGFSELTPRFREICNKDTSYLQIENDGIMDAETKVLIMLLDNKNEREDFFCNSYSIGTACSGIINSDMKVRTMIVLADYLVTNKYNKRKRFSIDHPVFKDLAYKKQVVSSDIKLSGNLINAKFFLENGTTKEAVFQI